MSDRQELCTVCHRASLSEGQRQTCTGCLGWCRRSIIRLEQLYAVLPAELIGRSGAASPMDPSGIRADTDQIPGGDVMVMLGPGSTRWHSDPVDVDSILGQLDRWEQDWRICFGEAAADDEATVSGCSLYLLRRLTRAAQEHPAFDEWAEDLRQMLARLESALRMSPQRSPVPCITCRRRGLERVVPRKGQAYDWACSRCHKTYTWSEYWIAARQHGEAV